MTPAELIPRHLLFANPDRLSPRLSPDGTRLAFLAPAEGVLNVWVGPAGAAGVARPVTTDRGRGIRDYLWAYTGRSVLHLQDRAGDENWHVSVTDLNTGATRALTPLEGVAARLTKASPRHPGHVLIALNDRDPRYHDVYRVAVATGERTLLLANHRFMDVVADDDLELRLGLRLTAGGGMEIQRRSAGGAWGPFLDVAPEDTLTTAPHGLDASGRVLYLRDSRGRDTAALAALDMTTGALRVLAADPRADAADCLSHPVDGHVEAVAFNYDRVRWAIVDDRVAADLEFLAGVAGGEVRVTSRTLADDRWIVAGVVDAGPVRYFLYDRGAREARFLFSERAGFDGLPLARMHARVLRAHDGLDLVSYLSLPPWADPDAAGRPRAPLPMVLLVHGGPWTRDAWGYDAHHQWLTNRGYAVLSVNYRGSTGFGKAFLNAGDRQWAAAMHDDLLDALAWAVREGIADPARVAIMGGSYGGYATLVGLAFTPETFACGVDIVGPSNLVTLLESIPPYWTSLKEQFIRRVGDPSTPEGRRLLLSRSPLTRANRIRRPLLIGQGANDPRVRQTESDRIVAALAAKAVPVTYVLYPDEGHGFARPENRLSFYAAAEAFLARHLGGRYEPVGMAFEGSSITVPAGAAQIPGLAEALAASRGGRAPSPGERDGDL